MFNKHNPYAMLYGSLTIARKWEYLRDYKLKDF